MTYFQFQDPWLFLLLAIIPLLIYRTLKNRPATLHYSSLDTLKTLHRKGLDFLAATPLILRCIAIALLVTALARPQEGRKSTEILSAGVDILLAIDTSGSMQAMDFEVSLTAWGWWYSATKRSLNVRSPWTTTSSTPS
jgi:Ca-activated chloride channel family protein